MELLAPAGNWESFLAAVHNGADAVYLGGENYSARQSADNFSLSELERALDYAHKYRRKVYVTVNTLISTDEMPAVLDYLYELYVRGVDAVIVQDAGMVDLAGQILPDLRLHASTQMTVHNEQGVRFLREKGIQRTVLARECSYDDIRLIRQELPQAELEVFIHGALCYSYSGQCLFSSLAGGRSGNRGRCAQPCRLPYDLYRNGEPLAITERGRYVLSPADLCLLDFLPQLQELAIDSLKIEGRMKRPEYVAVVTRVYREALDYLEENQPRRPMEELHNDLRTIFNRNFSPGYFMPDQQDFLSDKRPNNRGIYVGRVVEAKKGRISIRLSDNVSVGDGLTVWVSKGRNPSGTVQELYVKENKVDSAHKGDIINVALDGKVNKNDRVFKTHAARLLEEAAASIQNKLPKIPVDAHIRLEKGQVLELLLRAQGYEARVSGTVPLQSADKHPLSYEVLRDKLGRMGSTPFELRRLDIEGDLQLMIPFSEINELRRAGTDLLENKMKLQSAPALERDLFQQRKNDCLHALPGGGKARRSSLSVMTNGYQQAILALQQGADRVYIGLEGMGEHRRLKMNQLYDLWDRFGKDRVVLSMPRISKPADRFSYRDFIERSRADTIMVGNLGDLRWSQDQGLSVYGDHSFNVFNPYTMDFYLRNGLHQLCLSPELNWAQLKSFPNFHQAELLVHGQLIMMVSEHCMLGDMFGFSREKCQRPCQQGAYTIQDEKGYVFPVSTDADCRFYVLNAHSLCMLDDIPRILALQPGSIRIEARQMQEQELKNVVAAYRLVVDQEEGLDLQEMRDKLEDMHAVEFTRGHYYRGVL